MPDLKDDLRGGSLGEFPGEIAALVLEGIEPDLDQPMIVQRLFQGLDQAGSDAGLAQFDDGIQ